MKRKTILLSIAFIVLFICQNSAFAALVQVEQKFIVGSGDGSSFSREATWSAAKTSTAGYGQSTSDLYCAVIAEKDDGYYQCGQAHFPFNTSLPASASIVSAELNVMMYYHSSYSTNPQTVTVVASDLIGAPAMNNANMVQSTEFVDARITVPTAISATEHQTFILNEAGKSYINVSGTSIFALRASYDIDNNIPTGRNLFYVYFYEFGEASRAFLKIIYNCEDDEAPTVGGDVISVITLEGGGNGYTSTIVTGEMRFDNINIDLNDNGVTDRLRYISSDIESSQRSVSCIFSGFWYILP